MRREEKERERGLRLNVFARKKKKKMVTWWVRIDWRKNSYMWTHKRVCACAEIVINDV